MKPTLPLVVAILGVLAGPALAQEGPEPPSLELPVGARVRLQTRASGGQWVEGILAGANRGGISLVPTEAPPLGENRLRLPSEDVTRLELLTGKKKQWLPGLLIGAALGVTIGATTQVDPVQCQFDDNYFCSRGAAVGAMGGTMAGLGALVGALVKKDVWTPVALEALAPYSSRPVRSGLQLQAVPGGMGVAMSVRF